MIDEMQSNGKIVNPCSSKKGNIEYTIINFRKWSEAEIFDPNKGVGEQDYFFFRQGCQGKR